MKPLVATIVIVLVAGTAFFVLSGGTGPAFKLFDRTVPENRPAAPSPTAGPAFEGRGASELWAAVRSANSEAPWIRAVTAVTVGDGEVRVDTPYTLDGRGKSLTDSICSAFADHVPEGTESVVVTGDGGQVGATCRPS